VIDDVFCQIARGRITNNPYTETDYNFNVEDDATTIHKNIPPQISTYLGLLNNAVQREQGAVVPVVFGNVPYSPLGRNQAVNNILQLNPPYYPAAARSYTDNLSAIPPTYALTLYFSLDPTQLSAFLATNPTLAGMYLSVISGDNPGSSTPINATNKYYKIIGCSAITGTGPWSVTLQLADPIIETTGAGSDTLITESNFNSACAISSGGVATAHTWWFEITNLSFSANVSQNPVQVNGVLYYDSGLNIYHDESSALLLSATPETTVDLIANTVGTDGSVTMFERINLQMLRFGLSESDHSSSVWETYSDTDSIGKVTSYRSRQNNGKTIFDCYICQ
jgi:hypothetical protein